MQGETDADFAKYIKITTILTGAFKMKRKTSYVATKTVQVYLQLWLDWRNECLDYQYG